jgi:hypothetical protein
MYEIILLPLGEEPSRGQIAQAKYLLQEQWQLWRQMLPSSHAKNIIGLARHFCLDDVYHSSYERLHLLELTLRPSSRIITDYDELVRNAEGQAKQTIDGIEIADAAPE